MLFFKKKFTPIASQINKTLACLVYMWNKKYHFLQTEEEEVMILQSCLWLS